jgi:hypothetical protein
MTMPTSKVKIAICILTIKPTKILCKSLIAISDRYDKYIAIDDEDFDLTDFTKDYPKITFIQIKLAECVAGGFIHSLFPRGSMKPFIACAWDRALYYFSKKNDYGHIWLLEYDVFYLNGKCFENLDSKYPDSDLLSATNEIRTSEKWHWNRISAISKIDFPEPWFKSMVCCVRISNQLMNLVSQYAKDHKTLFYHEVLFNTAAFHNGLKVDNPREMSTVVFSVYAGYKNEDVICNPSNFFHPVKNEKRHLEIRMILSSPASKLENQVF